MDKFLILAYDYLFENLNILECGSQHNGCETLNLRLKNNCYYIEANPPDYECMLQQPNVKKENIFNFALSDHNGECSFTVTSLGGNSSISHSKDHIDELNIHGATFKTITVKSYTYNFFVDVIIKRPIDVLILDIEGGEINVLKTMQNLPVEKLPKIICIEAGYDWSDRKNILIALGYDIDFYAVNNVFLSHKTCNIKKNIDIMTQINMQYKEFIWFGKTIFINDKI